MGATITINEKPPNLFRGLIAYRPRADRDSRENFLTEAFAYVLAMDPKVAVKIIEVFVEERFKVRRLISLSTQVSLRGDATSWGLPDLKIELLDCENRQRQVWIENKWGAFADPEQLTRYVSCLDRQQRTVPKHLVLLTPRHTDEKICPMKRSTVAVTHVSWSKVHEVVARHSAHPIAAEFQAFLKEQQLVVQPVTLAAVREYYRKSKAKEGHGEHDLVENLRILCGRALDALHPKTELSEDAYLIDNYGRVGLWMFGARVTLGLMHNPDDHCSAFLRESQPLDLIVRVEGPYKKAEAERERTKLVPLLQLLEKAGYACDQGRWRANSHSLLLGHYRDPFPFGENADAQVEWVLGVFRFTLTEIEGDEAIMSLLRGVRQYS